MHRTLILSFHFAFVLALPANANIIVTPGNWRINPAAAQSVDAITAALMPARLSMVFDKHNRTTS